MERRKVPILSRRRRSALRRRFIQRPIIIARDTIVVHSFDLSKDI